MAKRKSDTKHLKGPPPSTPEARENQMIALATQLAEEQLRNGTASTQVIVHYLKLGTTKQKLEKEMLAKKTELITAQTESLEAARRIEELYANALEAMRDYKGGGGDEETKDIF